MRLITSRRKFSTVYRRFSYTMMHNSIRIKLFIANQLSNSRFDYSECNSVSHGLLSLFIRFGGVLVL